MNKLTYCEQHGHTYVSTTAPGWFRCEHMVNAKKGGACLCGAVAVCPGCLGYRLSGYVNMFCSVHYQTCVFDDFPVAVPAVTSDEQSLSGEQLQLW